MSPDFEIKFGKEPPGIDPRNNGPRRHDLPNTGQLQNGSKVKVQSIEQVVNEVLENSIKKQG